MVSRETFLAEALTQLGLATSSHPDAVSRLAQYAHLLETAGVSQGILGPREGALILERHIVESVAVLPLIWDRLPSWAHAAGSRASKDTSVGKAPGRGAGGLLGGYAGEGSPASAASRSGQPILAAAQDEAAWTGSVSPSRAVDLVDVGSGGGLPGLALACVGVGPVVLVESQGRRAAFLRDAVKELDVDARVERARAEVAARGALRAAVWVAICRALAAPAVALELTLPFVCVGGVAALMVGEPSVRIEPDERSDGAARAGSETRADRAHSEPGDMRAHAGDGAVGPVERTDGDRLEYGHKRGSAMGSAAASDVDRVAALLGGALPRWRGFEVPGVAERRWVMIVDKVGSTPEDYPRRAGVPQRRPLLG